LALHRQRQADVAASGSRLRHLIWHNLSDSNALVLRQRFESDSKLTRMQSVAMVSALAGGKALPAVLLEQILARTDGVPLFVEELTK
jgi:hypothetical protein